MSSPASASSSPAAASQAFDLLAEPVRRWIYDQGWQTLRDAQEAAIPLLLGGTADVIIAAATAAGKTEAAFLPICSRLAASAAAGPGVQVLYVAPLKALINDQYERLSGLCGKLDIPVHRWHGDVPGSRKSAVLKKPGGILLITPESLEALFVVRGPALASVLASLQYIVVDELHAFLGTERGAQLRSLMHRVELALRRRVPRVGLSATLGDMSLAACALRPGEADQVRLLLEGWCEPPDQDALHLSTLVQQLLSAIAQHGGVTAAASYRALCGPGTPFTAVTPVQFTTLLRSLGGHDVIVQADDGTLLLGQAGERTVNHYSFYAAFMSPEEYRLFTSGRPLGTMPMLQPVYTGVLLIFGGRRWKVTDVDHQQKIIDAIPAAGGRPPEFSGGAGLVHDRVRTEMRSVLAGRAVPRYLPPTAAALLSEARDAYIRYQLADHMMLRFGPGTVLFPWAGSRVMQTLAAQLSAAGLEASDDGLVITVPANDPGQVREQLEAMAAAGPADPVALAALVANKKAAKYDDWIGEDLLAADYARRALDCPGAWRHTKDLLGSQPPGP